ncbi:MAG: hypothetical protein LQ338_002014 [Usnochroma carphineum]|nr:MAG: hypothetical protein LQ338_002014 [Usnochroma carphineum]
MIAIDFAKLPIAAKHLRPPFIMAAAKCKRLRLPNHLPWIVSPLLDFLVPAFQIHPLPTSRPFSHSAAQASRVGAAAIAVPPDVNLRLLEPPKRRGPVTRVQPPKTIEVEGPLGKASVQLPPFVSYAINEATRKATLSVVDHKARDQREMWGTTRSYLANHILGVSEGHTAILRLVGVGYRATVEPTATTVKPEYPGQQFVVLKVGYAHTIELGVPKGVKASTPLPTRISLEGVDKEEVMSFAAKIRRWRVPEPYKGKGIFVNGETIKLKAKKIK